MLGFAAAMWALALDGRQAVRARRLIAGALLAGLAIGIRSQAAALTLPFLAIALVIAGSDRASAWRRRRRVRRRRARLGRAAASSRAAACRRTSHALGFAGRRRTSAAASSCCGSHHTARDAAHALLNTFIWPWDWWLGLAVCALAAAGAARIAWRAPRVLRSIVAGTFAPYAIFHLLFQETVTTRYALPLLPVIAYAAMAAVEGLPARALPAAAVGIAAIALMQTLPASVHYAREGAPVFRAFDDMAATAHGGDRVDTIALHASARRAAEWATPILPARVAMAPHGHEWLTLVELWKAEPGGARLVRRRSRPERSRRCSIRARAISRAPIAGDSSSRRSSAARAPTSVDWYHMQPPNWMLDRGWSVTAEVGGVTARDKQGPPLTPAIAWLEASAAGDDRRPGRPASRRRHRARHRQAERLAARDVPGAARVLLPAAHAAGRRARTRDRRYVPLEVTSVGRVSRSSSSTPSRRACRCSAYGPGWCEPEFNLGREQAWRWTSEKADAVGASRRPRRHPAARRRVPAALLRRRAARPRARSAIARSATFDPVVGLRSGHHAARRSPRRARTARSSSRARSSSCPRRRRGGPASSRAADLSSRC